MSTDTPSPSSTVSAGRERESRYLVVAGVVVAVLGVAAILAPLVTGIGISIALGVLLVVAGLTHVANAFGARGWTGSLWQVVLAVVYTLAGVSLLVNPTLGLTTLTLLLVAYLVVSGLFELVIGVKMRPDSRWGWFVASGVVSLVLGGLLWAGFPSTAAWAVGLLVGVNLLTTGSALVLVGLLDRDTPVRTGDETADSGRPSR